MNKKITFALLVLFAVNYASINAQTSIDTTYAPMHVFSRFQQVIAKVDNAVIMKQVDAFLDEAYNKKLRDISELEGVERVFVTLLSQQDDSTGSNSIIDSTFSISNEIIDFNSCIPVYSAKPAKDSAPSFVLTGYGFGKLLTNSTSHQSIYYLKTEDIERILTQREVAFFNDMMKGGFTREPTTLADGKTTWTISIKPVGPSDAYKAGLLASSSVERVFDTLLKLGVIPASFAVLDSNGNVHYVLSDESKVKLAKYPKLEVANIIRIPTILVMNNEDKTPVQLGWMLENVANSGRMDRSVLPMKEACFVDQSIFQKYCPDASEWINLIF